MGLRTQGHVPSEIIKPPPPFAESGWKRCLIPLRPLPRRCSS
jgi:hypothetical protein